MRDFRRIKIDEDDVPPSRHALFFRGFDLHLKRDEIQKYFCTEIGPCNVIFYKERRETLCVAIRFDSREDANECFKRFEGKKVMSCSVDMQWYKDVRAYADKVEREFRYKSFSRRKNNYHTTRYSRHSNSKRSHHHHSSSRAVSISSDDSPKRKHRRRRSTSSGTNHRSRSSSRTSSASSVASSRSSRSRSSRHRRRSNDRKIGPHTPPQTPPLDQTEEFESSFVGPEFIKFDTIGEGKNIGLITLNRPNRQNAFCLPMLVELAEHVVKFENDRQIAAIILTGDKENFASGFDIGDLKSLDSVTFEEELSKNWKRITETTKPLIAAVSGNALGFGFELMLNCDIVYAGTEAQFGLSNELVSGFGGTQLLTRLLGKSFTMEMCLTGARISADEAVKRNLISKTFPVDEVLGEAIKLAEIIAKNPTPFNLFTKKNIDYALDSLLQAGLTFERQVFHSMLATTEIPKEEEETVIAESNNLNGTS